MLEAIDYFVSGDIGENEFIERFNKIVQRNKKYIKNRETQHCHPVPGFNPGDEWSARHCASMNNIYYV